MVLTRDEVRAFDRFCIDRLSVPSIVLMENAARNAAQFIARRLLAADVPVVDAPVVICVGLGNNGGDGLAIARHLAGHGIETWTVLTADEKKLTDDARTNLRILQALRLPHATYTGRLPEARLVVDALGGTGIRGALREPTAEIVERVNAQAAPVIAIDIPTGLDCDTGTVDGPCIRAAATVTFVARKRGFDNPDSASFTGEVHVVDIGVPTGEVLRRMGTGPG